MRLTDDRYSGERNQFELALKSLKLLLTRLKPKLLQRRPKLTKLKPLLRLWLGK